MRPVETQFTDLGTSASGFAEPCQCRANKGYCQHRATDSSQKHGRKGTTCDQAFVVKDVDEYNHNQRLRLQHPSDNPGFARFPAKEPARNTNAEQLGAAYAKLGSLLLPQC